MTFRPFHHAGLRFSLWDDGEPGDPRLPVVFQHGLCGAEPQVAEIFPAAPGLRRLTLECRGHGASEPGPLDALSIATFTDDLAAMIERRVGGPVVVGGISMGAAIALRLAATRPDLVRALVLARPAWVTDSAPANMQPNALVGRLLTGHPAEEAQRRFEASDTARHLAAAAPDNLASLRGFFARAPQPVTAALLRQVSADGPGVPAAALAALGLPTLVLGHGRDEVHPFGHAVALAQLIPKARLTEITPKVADRSLYTREFRAALAGFLDRLAATATSTPS
ncbi:alpha/beta fold hydrolase [Geminicoccus roseus]|uniref:alpha/beta fold hydrolase n=1 Tax=Geminicoccus roseus TaxID=404900 RepID=UPI00042574DB|nr:alpha/beta hydrolase [Geminicoccus roseus]